MYKFVNCRIYNEITCTDACEYFDCIAPSAVKFYTDHYIVGNSYSCQDKFRY